MRRISEIRYRWKIFKATHQWKTFKISHQWKMFKISRQMKEAFLNETKSSFGFLIEGYGFVPQKTRHYYVVAYQSKNVEFGIYLDPRCNEIDGGIKLIESQRRSPYGLEMVLEAALSEGHGIELGMPPQGPEGVKHAVRRLAELVKKYYDPFLRGEASAFEMLEQVETQMGHRGMEQYRQEVRERAALAYQQKDYATAVRLYEHIEAYLAESDLQKLESSRKKGASPTSGEA
jgi:hypothetical protein